MLAPENARASRNQGRLEPYCKTHSRRTEHTISLWYSPLASCDPGEQDQRAHWSTLTTGRIKTLERGVRGVPYRITGTKEILSKNDDFLWETISGAQPVACVRGYVPRPTYGMHFYCAHCLLLLCLLFVHAPAGTGYYKGGHEDEVALFVETLALRSVEKSTHKHYLAK